MTATISAVLQARTQPELLAEARRCATAMHEAGATVERLTAALDTARERQTTAVQHLARTAEAKARQLLHSTRVAALTEAEALPDQLVQARITFRAAILAFLDALRAVKEAGTAEASGDYWAAVAARDAAQARMDAADTWVALWGTLNVGVAHQVMQTDPRDPATFQPLLATIFGLVDQLEEAEAARPETGQGA